MSYNPYLGEEPPADAYATMDVEEEFEGGQWIDGEFYYEKQRERPKARHSKAQAIYGVWAEDEDDEEEKERQAARRSKRRDEEMISDDDQEDEVEDETAGRRGLGLGASAPRNGAKYGKRQSAAQNGSLLTRTMKFVSSSASTLQPPADTKPPAVTAPPQLSSQQPASSSPHPTASSSAADDSTPATTLSFKRRRLAQQAEINRQKQPSPADTTTTTPTSQPPPRPFRPPTVDADYAAFTQHSTPAVLQMMERMGFRGRLGKHETGVALPILPQVRPKGVGLGGVKEKVQRVGRNAEEEEKIEEEEKQKKAAQEDRKNRQIEERRGGVGGSGVMREKAWKRGERHTKPVYKTAHEVIQQHSKHPHTTTTTPTVIIDMTSGTPIQKQLSSLTTTSTATSTSTQPSAVLQQQQSACPELVYNVQLLCDLCENDIVDTERRIERLTLDIDTMTRDETRMRVRARKEAEAEKRLEAVIAEVDDSEKRLKECEGETVRVRLDVVERLYHRLTSEWMREWRMYGLVRVVVVLLLPLLKELAGRWQVLPTKADRDSVELFDELRKWREWLNESTSTVYYDELVNTLLLPPLHLALSSTSLSLQYPTPIVSLFHQLRAVLPPRLYSSVVSSQLLPRLQRVLSAYNPRAMAAPYWLLSYARVVSTDELQLLAGIVRQRLMLNIGGWKVEDDMTGTLQEPMQRDEEVEEVKVGVEERMVDRVKGWKGVWKDEEMDAFLSRYIQPRLLTAIASLSSPTASTPSASSLPLVSAVLAWASLFSPLAFTPVLSAVLSFFLSLLHRLLSQRDVDFELVTDVYEQWKGALADPSVPSSHRTLIDEVSRRALAMMNAAIEDVDTTAHYRDAVHYLTHNKSNAATADSKPRVAANIGIDERDAGSSMRDVLYAYGSTHGFDVYPHSRRCVSGHDVYWFGGVQVHWRGDDVYAMDERTKEWELVSLSQLLQLAKQAQGAGRT